MKTVKVTAVVRDQNADEIFAQLCDFDVYPEVCPAVRAVKTRNLAQNEILSEWEVNFNGGILKWKEHDHFHPLSREIRFQQTSGDIDHFSGRWSVTQQGDEVHIAFDAVFDLGLPMLEDMLNPIAEKTISDNIRSIIHSLFFEHVVAGEV